MSGNAPPENMATASSSMALTSTPQTAVHTTSSRKSDKKGKAKDIDRPDNGFDVTFELQNGERSWHRHIKESKTLIDVLPKVAKHLMLPADGMRLSQIRDGREIEILDDFDWAAIKQRTMKESPSRAVVLKVSQAPGPSRSPVTTDPIPVIPVTKAVKKEKYKKRPALDVEGREVAPAAVPVQTPKRKKKTVEVTKEPPASGSPAIATSAPPPSSTISSIPVTPNIAAHSPLPTSAPKKQKKQPKPKSISESLLATATSAPSPSTITPIPETPAMESPASVASAKKEKKQVKRKAKSAATSVPSTTSLPVPVTPSAPGTSSQQGEGSSSNDLALPVASIESNAHTMTSLPSAQSPATPTSKSASKRKRVLKADLLNGSEATAAKSLAGAKRPRSPSPPSSDTTTARTPASKKRRRHTTEEPSGGETSSSTPPVLPLPVLKNVLHRYKPVKPSPLGRLVDPISPRVNAIPLSDSPNRFELPDLHDELPFRSSSSFDSPPASPVKPSKVPVAHTITSSVRPSDGGRLGAPTEPASEANTISSRRQKKRARQSATPAAVSMPPINPVVATSSLILARNPATTDASETDGFTEARVASVTGVNKAEVSTRKAPEPIQSDAAANSGSLPPSIRGPTEVPATHSSEDARKKNRSRKRLSASAAAVTPGEKATERIMREFREKMAIEAGSGGTPADFHFVSDLIESALSKPSAGVTVTEELTNNEAVKAHELEAPALGEEMEVDRDTGAPAGFPEDDVLVEDPITVQPRIPLVTIAFQTDEEEPILGQVVNVSKELLKNHAASISDVPTSSTSKAGQSQAQIAQDDVLASNSPAVSEQVGASNVLPNGTSSSRSPAPELELFQTATNPPAVSQNTVPETVRPSSPEAAQPIPEILAKGRAKGRRSAPSSSPIVESSEDENMSSRGGKKPNSRKSEASDMFWSAYDSNGILTAAQRRQLAQRGVCAICLASQTHLQKDCPVVKDGLQSLQNVLAERRKAAEESQGSLAVELAPSIEAIENWIQRLTKVKKRVISGAQTQNRGSWTSPVRIVHDVSTPSPELPSVPTAAVPSIDLISPSSDALTNGAGEDAGRHEAATNALNSPPSDTPIHNPTTAPTSTAGEQYLPQIHLRALQRPRKAGSLSGLSVSDARIETEDSASESESGSDSGSMDEDEQLDSEDDESSGEEDADSKSATSETQSLSEAASESGSESNESDDGRSVPSDPEQALQHFMSKPLSRKEQETARLSAIHLPASTPLVEAVEPSSESEESASDDVEPQALPAGSRNRAESVSSIGDFGDAVSQASSEAHSDIRPISQIPAVKPAEESISTTSSAATSPSPVLGERARRFAEIDEMAGASPAVEQFPGVVALNEAIADEERPEKEATNDVVVQEAFGSDALGAPWNGRAKVVDGLPSPPSSHSGMDAEATQLDPRVMQREVDGELTPRAKRGAPTSQSLAPPAEDKPVEQPLLSPIQTSQRRLRSKTSDPQDALAASQASVTRETRRTSRQPSATPKQRHAELVVELSPRITTRSMSKELTVSPRMPTRSLVPASPGTRRSSRTEATPPPRVRSLRSASAGLARDVDGGSTANGNGQRITRSRHLSPQQSSQIDELDSSQPNIPPLVQSAEQNGDALSSSAPQPSQSARTHDSPLFMTQGSQPLVAETQAYNVFPSLIEPERSQSPSSETFSRSNGSVTRGSRRVVRPASPILEEDEGSATPVPNGHANGTVASSSVALESDVESDNVATTTNAADEDDESSIFVPPARTTLAAPSRQYSLASSQPALSIPTLSGLSKDALRNRSFMRGASSQPVKSSSSGMLHGLGKDESSDSEASNSSDEEVPNGLKGRIAGRRPGLERRRTNGNMVGW